VKTLNLKRNRLTEACLQHILGEYSQQKNNYLSQVFLKGNLIDSVKHNQELQRVQHLGILIYM
jgi:hypothetical protein